jgi:hypothetical protein
MLGDDWKRGDFLGLESGVDRKGLPLPTFFSGVETCSDSRAEPLILESAEAGGAKESSNGGGEFQFSCSD